MVIRLNMVIVFKKSFVYWYHKAYIIVLDFVEQMICYTEFSTLVYYGKCPKNSYSKVSSKMVYANSADPDQTAPEGLIRGYTFCHSTK